MSHFSKPPMSGNAFKSFAVLGAGTLGLPLAEVSKLSDLPVLRSNLGYPVAGRERGLGRRVYSPLFKA